MNHFDSLPFDMKTEIFSWLSLSAAYRASQVSRQWSRQVWLSVEILRIMSRHKIGHPNPTPYFHRLFQRLNPARITSFSINLQNFGNNIWDYLIQLHNLQALGIVQCDLITRFNDLLFLTNLTKLELQNDDCDPNIICQCTTLESLTMDIYSISLNEFNSSHFRDISRLTRLRHLSLYLTATEESCFELFAALTGLQSLSIDPVISSHDLMLISHFTNLTLLNCNKASLYRSAFAAIIPRLTLLEELHIDHTNLPQEEYSHVSLLTNLHTLLLHSSRLHSGLPAVFFEVLSPCTKLTSLKVYDVIGNPNALFATLRKLPNIAALDITVGCDDIRGLMGLTRLRSLNVGAIRFTEETIGPILSSLNLTQLTIDVKNFKHNDYHQLSMMTSLRSLNLTNLSSSAEDVRTVLLLPNMEELVVLVLNKAAKIVKTTVFSVTNTMLRTVQIAVRLVTTTYIKIDIGTVYWKKYQKTTL